MDWWAVEQQRVRASTSAAPSYQRLRSPGESVGQRIEVAGREPGVARSLQASASSRGEGLDRGVERLDALQRATRARGARRGEREAGRGASTAQARAVAAWSGAVGADEAVPARAEVEVDVFRTVAAPWAYADPRARCVAWWVLRFDRVQALPWGTHRALGVGAWEVRIVVTRHAPRRPPWRRAPRGTASPRLISSARWSLLRA